MTDLVENKLSVIVQTLERSIYKSEMAIGDDNKGYPYAAGYAVSALKLVLGEINYLQSKLSKNTIEV